MCTHIMSARAQLRCIAVRPQMYASTREALLALVTGIAGVVAHFDSRDVYRKHLGTEGCAYEGADKPFDDAWGRAVVMDVLAFLAEVP